MMNLFESKNPYRNPLTYLMVCGFTLLWWGSMLLCDYPRGILLGSDPDFQGDGYFNTVVFLFISSMSILGYWMLTFAYPNLLFRVITGIVWAPLTCVIYGIIVLLQAEGELGISVSWNDLKDLKWVGSLVIFVFLAIPAAFVLTCWYVLIPLVPITIMAADRLSHRYGLTAAAKWEAMLIAKVKSLR